MWRMMSVWCRIVDDHCDSAAFHDPFYQHRPPIPYITLEAVSKDHALRHNIRVVTFVVDWSGILPHYHMGSTEYRCQWWLPAQGLHFSPGHLELPITRLITWLISQPTKAGSFNALTKIRWVRDKTSVGEIHTHTHTLATPSFFKTTRLVWS